MKLNRTDAFWDRKTRNDLNENWDIIEGNTRKLEDDFRNVVNNITDDVVEQLVDNAKLNWKEPVPSHNNLPGNAQVGDTRMTRDTGKVYRFNGSAWVEIQQIDAGPVNEVDSRLTAQLADTMRVSMPVEAFGAVGDGVTDDLPAIRAAMQSRYRIKFSRRRYRITDELVLNLGNVDFDGQGNLWNGNEYNTVFVYDGPADPNKAVIRASRSPVGVEPTVSLDNVKLRNITIDGNGKAGYGLYAGYVSNDSMIDGVSAVNTTQHGIRIEKCWYASFRNLVAKDNFGCGITIGKGFSSGSSVNGQVNSVYFSNIRAHNNGRDLSFDVNNKLEWGYGVGIYNGYNLKLMGVTSENNDGAGIIFRNSLPNSGIDGLYCERNDSRGTADRALAVVYIGETAGRGHFLRDVYLWGEHTHTRPQSILLTGTKPAGTLDLVNINFGKLTAEWDRYTLSNSYYGLTDYIEGHLPQNEIIGGYNLTTLYVRSNGNDNNDGRTTSTAFASLSKAIQAARYAERVTTIDCTGATISETILDFSKVRKEIIIIGNSARVTNTTVNRGIEILNAKYGVVLRGFQSISRILSTNSFVKVENSNISLADTGAFGIVYGVDSDIRLLSCSLGTSITSGTMTGITASNCKLTLENTNFGVFTTGRYIQLRDGSYILSDNWLTAFETGYATIDDAGYIMGGNKMRNKSGAVTFS